MEGGGILAIVIIAILVATVLTVLLVVLLPRNTDHTPTSPVYVAPAAPSSVYVAPAAPLAVAVTVPPTLPVVNTVVVPPPALTVSSTSNLCLNQVTIGNQQTVLPGAPGPILDATMHAGRLYVLYDNNRLYNYNPNNWNEFSIVMLASPTMGLASFNGQLYALSQNGHLYNVATGAIYMPQTITYINASADEKAMYIRTNTGQSYLITNDAPHTLNPLQINPNYVVKMGNNEQQYTINHRDGTIEVYSSGKQTILTSVRDAIAAHDINGTPVVNSIPWEVQGRLISTSVGPLVIGELMCGPRIS